MGAMMSADRKYAGNFTPLESIPGAEIDVGKPASGGITDPAHERISITVRFDPENRIHRSRGIDKEWEHLPLFDGELRFVGLEFDGGVVGETGGGSRDAGCGKGLGSRS